MFLIFRKNEFLLIYWSLFEEKFWKNNRKFLIFVLLDQQCRVKDAHKNFREKHAPITTDNFKNWSTHFIEKLCVKVTQFGRKVVIFYRRVVIFYRVVRFLIWKFRFLNNVICLFMFARCIYFQGCRQIFRIKNYTKH